VVVPKATTFQRERGFLFKCLPIKIASSHVCTLTIASPDRTAKNSKTNGPRTGTKLAQKCAIATRKRK
jgi:hypothetical protein